MNLRIRTDGLAAATVAVTLAMAGTAVAQNVVEMPPNLVPLPASDFSLVADGSGGSTLRFTTVSWNKGAGPLELAAGAVETGSGKRQVYQHLYRSDGSSSLHYAGAFQYHPEHNHMHFDDFAIYSLQPVNAPGGSSRTGVKTTFCLMDTNRVSSLPGSPSQPFYSLCGRDLQGISVGWADTYGSHLAGQSVDFTGNADGIYQLKIDVDPKKLLVEGNEEDNVSCVLLNIRKPSSVTVLDSSGQCSTVAAITPNVGRIGSSVEVVISGYGFTPGMAVSFTAGNGPRPVASNVRLTSDTDTIDQMTATVTVPFKRKGGRDPLWDVQVGSGGLLRNGFRVTQ